MTQPLPADLELFVQQEIASGRYSSRDDVLLDGLRLLKRDREESLQGILEGLDSMQHGHGMPLDEAFEKIRQKVDGPTDA